MTIFNTAPSWFHWRTCLQDVIKDLLGELDEVRLAEHSTVLANTALTDQVLILGEIVEDFELQRDEVQASLSHHAERLSTSIQDLETARQEIARL